MYFTDLLSNSKQDVDFLKYTANKISEVPKYILEILPQAINYVQIEQIHDKLEYFSDSINENFISFNNLVRLTYEKKDDNRIEFLQKVLKKTPVLINEISDPNILLNLIMEIEDTGLLNATAQNMQKSKFVQLMRFINDHYLINHYSINEIPKNLKKTFLCTNHYLINEMPENLQKVSLCIIEQNLVKTSNLIDFYNFDFESRIFTAELYFSSKSEDTTKKNLLKNLLFDNKYVFETIKYAKTNLVKNDFTNAIEEMISSQFNKLPLESMLELLASDNSYMERFIFIFSNDNPNHTNNIFETLIQPQTLNKYKNQINEMLKNENFVAKLTNYINDKIINYDFFELCESENENIKNLISKERFMEWVKCNPAQLNIMVNYFDKYVNDLTNDILLEAFKSREYAVVRAVSDTKFKEISKSLPKDIKNDINKRRQFKNKKTINQNKQKDNNNEKTSHKTRNVSLITAGVFVASTFITLTILALIGTLTFGTGYIILFGALSAAGTGMTAWGSKSLDKEKIEELTIKDPIYYTKTEIAFYGCRKPIKERIQTFGFTASGPSILSRTKLSLREHEKTNR